MFDFNKLRNFLVVASAPSVTEAARKLNRTQSAISQQIQALEAELGLALFQRRGGRTYLTKEGHQLCEQIKPLFEQMTSRIRELQNRMDLVEGIVTIGASPSICDYLLLPHLQEFNRRHPRVCLELVLLPDERLEERLQADSLDFAFIINFKNRDLFQVHECFSFKEILVSSCGYLERYAENFGRKPRNYVDLENASFVDFERDLPNIRHWLRKNSPNHRSILLDKTASIVVEDYDSITRLVRADAGLAMIPQYIVKDDITKGSMVELFPKSTPTMVGVDFSLRKKKNLDASLQLFYDFFLNTMIKKSVVR